MKFKILLLLPLIFVSCFNLERDCKSFKTGKFKTETTVDNIKFESTFERNDSLQIENYKGVIDTFSVRWVNDCEYILENTNPKNRKEKKAVLVKILNTKNLTYNFEYSFVGDAIKQNGSVTKLN
jgi:hypothetical protein